MHKRECQVPYALKCLHLKVHINGGGGGVYLDPTFRFSRLLLKRVNIVRPLFCNCLLNINYASFGEKN